MFFPSVKIATPEIPSAGALKRKRSDDKRQWGIRSDVNSAAYRAKELTARDGSTMCECGVCLDDYKTLVQINVFTSIVRLYASLAAG